jgi:hypothetical protein
MEFLQLVSIPVSFLDEISRMLKGQANVLTITGRYRGSSMVSLTRGNVATSYRKAGIVSHLNSFLQV